MKTNDLISRAAIEWHDFLVADGNGMYHEEKVAYKRQIDTLPSAQPELHYDEWCTDCKEYDQERHCCPRFNRVIRGTVEEYKAEHPEPCDDPRADVYYLAEKIGIHRLYALVVELRGEPEPCEDAVSREAVLDMLHQECSSIVENFLKEKINAMPSVTAKAEQRWIPVTHETLPNPNSVVVVCGKKGTWDYGTYRGWHGDIHSWWWKKNTIKHVYWWMYKDDALPEPYREG